MVDGELPKHADRYVHLTEWSKSNPCTVFDVIQICQGLESVLELYWADRYPPFRPEPSEFLGPTRKAQQNRKERNCLRRTKECYQVCGAKLVLPSPIVIATDLGIVLREFPGTPRNGTPFWEASHTTPINSWTFRWLFLPSPRFSFQGEILAKDCNESIAGTKPSGWICCENLKICTITLL